MQRDLLKKENAQNLRCSVRGSGQFEFFVKDGNKRVNADWDLHLGLHRVGRSAEEVFDAQVLSKARQTASGSPEGGAQRHQQLDLTAVLVKLSTYVPAQLPILGHGPAQSSLATSLHDAEAVIGSFFPQVEARMRPYAD